MPRSTYDLALIESLKARIRAKEDECQLVAFPGPIPISISEAWELVEDLLRIVTAANGCAVHTLSYGNWQAFFSIWHDGKKDYYRTDRIANTPEEAIFLCVRDVLAGLDEAIYPEEL